MRPPAASSVTAAHQRGPVDRQTASDPIAEGVTNEVRRTAIQSFKDPSHIGAQVVHSYAIERAAALSSTAHVDTNGLQPSGSERARQIVKITAAAAGIREQHNRSPRTVEGAFERRAADFDVSVLLQSQLSRESADVRCLKRLVAGGSPS